LKEGKKQSEIKYPPKIKYPSAELLQSPCYEDYKRLIDTYDKIYEKVNIALAFCGIALLVILNSFDYTMITEMFCALSKLELFSLLTLLFSSLASTICMVWAVIQLLLLMHSRTVTVFDSIAARNEEIYRWSPDEAALWLIDKYTYAVSELRTIISAKQKKFDSAIIKIMISILAYAIFLIIEKGV